MSGLFTVDDCEMITLSGNRSYTGSIASAVNHRDIPFSIKRAYYLYDIPGGASRGGHAHVQLEQIIVAVSGSFDILINDGKNTRIVHLNRSNTGLHLRPGIWREITNFSSGAVCLALASEVYFEEDYIREYDDFKAIYGTN